MKQLLIADPHWSSEPEDAYRWGIFPWLRQQAFDELYILGDLTVHKDRHPSLLVNNFVDGLVSLTEGGKRDVHILAGNHDSKDPQWPFFRFVKHIPGIHFFHETQYFNIPVGRQTKSLAIIPFWPADNHPWEAWQPADIALFHGTVVGSLVENGMPMQSGVPAEAFKKFGKVWAGDIHVPQDIGNVEYIGAPYHIHYGDKFIPRVVLLNNWEYEMDLHYPTIRKELVLIRSPEDMKQLATMPAGSQVKVRVELPYAQAGEWEVYRDGILGIIEAAKLHLGGLELVSEKQVAGVVEVATQMVAKPDKEIVQDYGKMEKLSDERIETGVYIVDEVHG